MNKRGKMNKPYIQKFCKVGEYSVWIVDGNFIRKNIDEEFTNFGQFYRFNFIPQNELWIDKEHSRGEEKFYIDAMLTIIKAVKKGLPYAEAVKKATSKEKKERKKSKLFQEIKISNLDNAHLIDKLHIRLLKKYSGKKIQVWRVNGEIVRDFFFLDFTEGGHSKVYPFIPENEIWIDDDLSEREWKFVLLHEIHERNLMSKGMDYDHAHLDSSKIEYACRKNPKTTDNALRKEIKKLQR